MVRASLVSGEQKSTIVQQSGKNALQSVKAEVVRLFVNSETLRLDTTGQLPQVVSRDTGQHVAYVCYECFRE